MFDQEVNKQLCQGRDSPPFSEFYLPSKDLCLTPTNSSISNKQGKGTVDLRILPMLSKIFSLYFLTCSLDLLKLEKIRVTRKFSRLALLQCYLFEKICFDLLIARVCTNFQASIVLRLVRGSEKNIRANKRIPYRLLPWI